MGNKGTPISSEELDKYLDMALCLSITDPDKEPVIASIYYGIAKRKVGAYRIIFNADNTDKGIEYALLYLDEEYKKMCDNE